MSAYFSRHSLAFLQALAANNRRDWFERHKADYHTHVKAPFQRLLQDLAAPLAAISNAFHSDPRGNGGSLFRIHRDTRFSGDKSPYKPWQGARLYHSRRRHVPAPAFYLHVQPGASFVAAGLWHPDTATQRRVRQFIFDNPASWGRAVHAPEVTARFAYGSEEKLARPPAGFPKDFPYLDDLRERNFILLRPLDDAAITAPELLATLSHDLQQLAPFVDYLCAALDLEF